MFIMVRIIVVFITKFIKVTKFFRVKGFIVIGIIKIIFIKVRILYFTRDYSISFNSKGFP